MPTFAVGWRMVGGCSVLGTGPVGIEMEDFWFSRQGVCGVVDCFFGEYDAVVGGIEGNRYSWLDALRHSWCMLEGRWLVRCSPSTHVVYHISHTLGGDHKNWRSDQKLHS